MIPHLRGDLWMQLHGEQRTNRSGRWSTHQAIDFQCCVHETLPQNPEDISTERSRRSPGGIYVTGRDIYRERIVPITTTTEPTIAPMMFHLLALLEITCDLV